MLGLKKYGLGAGFWNGFGGKVEARETIAQAARRECEEETGLTDLTLEHRGVVYITYLNTEELAQGLRVDHALISEQVEMHVFAVLNWRGEAQETREMAPAWFAFTDIPYRKMWPDDKHWLPQVFAGKHFEMRCVFKDRGTMLSYELKETVSQSSL